MQSEDMDMKGDDPSCEERGAALHPGESFHGYVIEKQIGKGGLGTIWLGRHQMLDTLFAIKILDPEIAKVRPRSQARHADTPSKSRGGA